MKILASIAIFIVSFLVVKYGTALLVVFSIASGWNPSADTAKDVSAVIGIASLVIPIGLTVWYVKRKPKTAK